MQAEGNLLAVRSGPECKVYFASLNIKRAKQALHSGSDTVRSGVQSLLCKSEHKTGKASFALRIGHCPVRSAKFTLQVGT